MRTNPSSHALAAAALAACALLGCDQDPAAEPAFCADAAVAVEADGDRWCAHHDVARFTCPADLPHRTSYQGVAFCGPRAIDDGVAERIARAALHTGEVLEQREIFDFEVPAAWQAAPGAPSATPLDIEVRTFTASNVSWSSSDGDPALCTRQFERFEIEPDGIGRLRITAWDRLRCGPDELGMGLESEEIHPLTVPGLPPGRHVLSGGAWHGAPVSATIVVDLD